MKIIWPKNNKNSYELALTNFPLSIDFYMFKIIVKRNIMGNIREIYDIYSNTQAPPIKPDQFYPPVRNALP